MLNIFKKSELEKDFKNKIILITGGTGTFGKNFLKRLINLDCEIRIFSRDELKQDELRNEINDKKVKFYLGDVRDKESLISAMINVDYVFHAAALKQVPSCEFFPMQAIQTNILGSNNVINLSIKNKVKKLLMLSTDKAVYPINTMGCTKSLMEKILLSKARDTNLSSTILSIVRYGNVISSRGSVIPLFINQIKSNKDITITNPMMTRFLLSLENAIDLVSYALKYSQNGEIFIKKSPACTIKTLADCLIDIFKSKKGIKIIGERHGEKLFETLATKQELLRAKENKDFYKIEIDSRDLNYNSYYTQGYVSDNNKKKDKDDYTSSNTDILDFKSLKSFLLTLPEIKKELIK